MNLISSREQLYVALLALVTATPGIVTCTRHLRTWQDVNPEEQPALFMEHAGEDTMIVRGQPSRHILEVNLYLYVRNEAQQPAGPIMNPLLDALCNQFEPSNGGDHAQTLGGLAHHCWIEGKTQIFEGNLGEEIVAVVPVKVLVT